MKTCDECTPECAQTHCCKNHTGYEVSGRPAEKIIRKWSGAPDGTMCDFDAMEQEAKNCHACADPHCKTNMTNQELTVERLREHCAQLTQPTPLLVNMCKELTGDANVAKPASILMARMHDTHYSAREEL